MLQYKLFYRLHPKSLIKVDGVEKLMQLSPLCFGEGRNGAFSSEA